MEDQVLVKNVREKGGTGKLRSHWERSVFKILEKKKNLPVYVIENINDKKDQRTVHRNLLMECNDLPKHVFDDDSEVRVRKKQVNKKETETDDLEEEDDENIAVFVHEDVAGSLMGGGGVVRDQTTAVRDDIVAVDDDPVSTGDPVDLGDVPELVEVEVGADEQLDDTLPYGETDEEPTVNNNQDYDSNGTSQALRRSDRQSRKAKMFSYNEVGGPPVLVDVRCQLFPDPTPDNQ